MSSTGTKRMHVSVVLFIVASLMLCTCLLTAATSQWGFALSPEGSDDPYVDAISTELADGCYLIAVTLEGGTGRASISSPTTMTVQDGRAAARIEWSSPNYDYMIVNDKLYHPINEEGNSVFEIPVLAFDEPFTVIGDTTAMSQPHEIEYELAFDTSSIAAQKSAASSIWIPAALVVIAGGAVLFVLKRRRSSAA